MKTRAWMLELCNPYRDPLANPFRAHFDGNDWDVATNGQLFLCMREPCQFDARGDAQDVTGLMSRELDRANRVLNCDLEAMREWAAPATYREAAVDEHGDPNIELEYINPSTLFGIHVNRRLVWNALKYLRNPSEGAWRGEVRTAGPKDAVHILPTDRPCPWLVLIMPMHGLMAHELQPGFDAELLP